ncbi:hypothetical protein DFQ27_009445 [Actinomortierella ambigua]|uniref:Uncharacterized protein n=1 Tax=Actinomortierella ambigua TaxID=1343610 RepID=A0A9P6QGQ3_9FUNG|nr:hypothetical protein DFQ27_009445 [Actinomortierella ambigua]
MGTLFTTLAQLVDEDGLCRVQACIKLPSETTMTSPYQPAVALFRVFLRRSALTAASSIDSHTYYYSAAVNHHLQDLIHFLYPSQHESQLTNDAIRDLYTHVRAPPVTAQTPTPPVQPKNLLPNLLPFQRRSVAWMLSREGVTVDSQANTLSIKPAPPTEHNDTIPIDWEIVRYGDNEEGSTPEFLVHRLLGRVCLYIPDDVQGTTPSMLQRRERSGGILAEEMGLGKTVETMALILLHQRPLLTETTKQEENDGEEMSIDTDTAMKEEQEESDLAKSLSSSHLDDTADNSVGPSESKAMIDSAIVDRTTEGTNTTNVAPLLQSRATLIITPPSILYQWQSELASHAPSLSVYVYESHEGVTAEELANHDVVLATYNALGQDIYVARYQEREYRHKRQYVPRKSLFVQIHWWRICLDEAQLVEISTSKAAEMANILVRTHSWAISGTPVKKQSEDLHGLLLFLGVEPYASNKKLWRLVIQPSFRGLFLRCFQRIMRRHAKKDVEQELQIPPQRSLAHRIEFTAIEQANYHELWDQFLREVRWQTVEDGTADTEVLRVWLLRLRQTCCHPQIGAKNAQVLGGTGELRTITQVLDTMLYQAMSNLNAQERTLVTMRMNRAILHARINKSLEVVPAFESVHGEIQQQIEKWSKMVIEQRNRIRVAQRATRTLAQQTGDTPRIDNSSGPEGEEEDADDEGDHLLDEDDADGGTGNLARSGKSMTTPEGQLGMKRANLRHWMEQEHRVLFFVAGVYHDLKMVDEETLHYEMAEKVRLSLLSNAERQFLRRKAKVEVEVGKMVDMSHEFEIPESEVGHGIVLQSVVERLEALTSLLNEQLQMMQAWREDLVKRLLQPLMQDGEEGEQYQYSIELQHTLEAYLHYYGRMLLLRKDLLGGTSDAISTHKNLLKSKREQAIMVARREKRAAAANIKIGVPQQVRQQDKVSGDKGGESSMAAAGPVEKPVDKVEELDKQLEADLDSIIRPELEQSLRAFRNEIRSLPTRRDMPEIEKKMCELEAQRLSKHVEEQLELCQVLELETVQFRVLTADRTRYYRQLQQISDTVRDVQSMDPQTDIQESLEEEREVSATISQMASKLRYLEHLAETTSRRSIGGGGAGIGSFAVGVGTGASVGQANGSTRALAQQQGVDGQGQEASKGKLAEDDTWCLVCRGGSEFGTLTACGHVFCEECIMSWIAVRSVCPTCMAPIAKRHLTRVYMGAPKAAMTKGAQGDAGEGSSSNSRSNGSNSTGDEALTLATQLYGNIQQVPEAIKAMPVNTGYGSKVDSISRHIAFLIKENPSVKCIVFSQWQTVLDLLGASLDMNKIGYVKLAGGRSRKGWRGKAVLQFKEDPETHVFMLHAKSQSAGLTLLAATHVFICEPLVNPVLQAQAINRVHRIGQTKETYVHYYLVQDTIEMPVYDLFEQKMAARAGASNHHDHDQQPHDHIRPQSSDNRPLESSETSPAMILDRDTSDPTERVMKTNGDDKGKGKGNGKGKARAMPIELEDKDSDSSRISNGNTLSTQVSTPAAGPSERDESDQQALQSSSAEPSLTANAAKEAQDRSGELVPDEDVFYCFRAAKEAADLAQRVQTMGMQV